MATVYAQLPVRLQAKEWCFPTSTLRECRHVTKAYLRQPNMEVLLRDREADTDLFVQTALAPALQKALGLYIRSLEANKKGGGAAKAASGSA